MSDKVEIKVLRDLSDVIATTKENIRSFSSPAEFGFSAAFADALKVAFSDYSFEFYERTLKVTTPSKQYIYVSGQSFAIAVCLMDFCEELGRYRAIAYQVLNSNRELFETMVPGQGKIDDKVFTALRDGTNIQLSETFRVKAREYFSTECDDAKIAEDNVDYIMKFLTNYSWWLGGKQISRSTDWSISPISNLLNMPQNDSNFIARVVSKATDNEEFRTIFKDAIDREWYFGDDADQCRHSQQIHYDTGYQSNYPRNRIIFGAPGTGKSFSLNNEKNILLAEGGTFERVTFHPDYSYANFVGTYKPVPSKDSEGKDAITYTYVPGPFMRTYVKALQNSKTANPRPVLLVIEEINRANVAAVFGDVFQLLDRGDDNISEYPIQASEDIKKYLAVELDGPEGNPDDYAEIRIPDNMFIWATMNSADQGVFPMDTAFKRRWDFTYLGIDDNDEKIRGKYVILGKNPSQKVEWNKLRKAINNFLAKEKINEDKQLGPYFIAKNIIVPNDGDEIDRDRFISTFKNKVLMYLFEDAAKQRRPKIFEGCFENSSRYSEICKEFDQKGIGIFHHEIQIACEPEDLLPEQSNTEE